MLGALITFLFGLGILGLIWSVGREWIADLDPAEQLGICGLVGLGLVGLDTLLIGLIPGGLNWGMWIEGGLALAGYALAARTLPKLCRFKTPESWRLGILAALGLALLFSLVGALGPSDMNDWDSIAYHLAVPKIWLGQGQIEYIPYIHHSNFPGALDNLFIWGLKWGGQSGAKAFSVLVFGLGMLALFGLGRRLYGEKAGWWAALAFAAIPCALWESGTAYIDVGHGLFAGLGILYTAEFVSSRRMAAAGLAAVCLALGCATKYTGLQTLFACLLVLSIFSVLPGRHRHPAPSSPGQSAPADPSGHPKPPLAKVLALYVLLPLLIAGPWYLRNVVNTANPVYPFFYEIIGSRNWDAFSARIYKEEQQTFGVGHSPTALGAAILGLAYQPGRYVNPGQTQGLGMPTGALGAAAVAAWLAWLASGRLRRFEMGVLAVTSMSLLMWFVLSQQSRYLVTLGVPAALLAGAAVIRLRAGPILAGLVALQAAWALFIGKVFLLDPKLPVVVGKVSEEEYLKAAVSFYPAAQTLNQIVPKEGRVALYDEVFGYYLDVPYFWANPGHSTLIPYGRIENGVQLADELRKLGFTHVYMNTSVGIAFPSREAREKWAAHAGLTGEPIPFTEQERAEAATDLRNKWRVLLAEAVAERRIVPLNQIGSGIVFELKS